MATPTKDQIEVGAKALAKTVTGSDDVCTSLDREYANIILTAVLTPIDDQIQALGAEAYTKYLLYNGAYLKGMSDAFNAYKRLIRGETTS